MPTTKRAIHQVSAPPGSAGRDQAATPNLEAIRLELARIIGTEASQIVVAAIVKAKAGQFQAMKYLFELAGIHPAHTSGAEGGDVSLTQLLCREMGLPEEANPAAEENASPGSSGNEPAVK